MAKHVMQMGYSETRSQFCRRAAAEAYAWIQYQRAREREAASREDHDPGDEDRS